MKAVDVESASQPGLADAFGLFLLADSHVTRVCVHSTVSPELPSRITTVAAQQYSDRDINMTLPWVTLGKFIRQNSSRIFR